MEPIEFIPYYYYSSAWYIALLILSWITTLYYVGSNEQKILRAEGNSALVSSLLLILASVFFLGLREIAKDFGDTVGYAGYYERITNLTGYMPYSLKTEWLWSNIQIFTKNVLGMNVHDFFVLVAFGYFGGMFICSVLLVRKNLWIAMMFFLTAFSTYSYGTNGIRNGLACSLILVAIAEVAMYAIDKKNSKRIVAIILMLMALVIHRSTMLPSVAAFASLYFIKDTKTALRFWFASIAISLVAGPLMEQFFGALGFDDRMSDYSEAQNYAGHSDNFSHVGFRWDFLLYSSFPVALIWYVTRYRHFNDPAFTVIANTYLLCNSFWIMVIRAAFSNRFAYLSWFIYPLVFIYPLLRMNLWKDQDRKTSLTFFLYSGFTFFMFFIFYFGTTGFKGFDQYWWRK